MRLRPAPGGDSVGAAVGEGSDHVESREHRRDAQHARRRARRRRQAPRLRRLVVRVRRHADAAQARGHADRRRCRPTRCRSSSASSTCQMFTRLYGLETVTHPLFQRLRPAAGSRRRRTRASSRSSRRALLDDRSPNIYGDGEQTRDFTYVANVVDGVLRACEAPKRERRSHQRRDRRQDFAEHAVRAMREHHRRRTSSRPTFQAAAGRRPRLAGRHQQGQGTARLRADRVVRGRTRGHDRVVPDRSNRRDSIEAGSCQLSADSLKGPVSSIQWALRHLQ